MIEVAPAKRSLTAQDRCDSCGAAAQVVATFLSGELMFCGHHARKSKNTLIIKSLTIFDPENYLNLLN